MAAGDFTLWSEKFIMADNFIDSKFIDDAIKRHYSERDSLGWYHGTRHVTQVRDLLWKWHAEDKFKLDDRSMEVLDTAAVYHDAVYIPGDAENERSSALKAESELKDSMEAGRLLQVGELIMSTKFPDAITERGDFGMFGDVWCSMRDMLHDADWYGFHNLGELLENEPGILAEIRWALMNAGETVIPLQSFMRRRQFLENLLELLEAGNPMFRTEHMKAYNDQAEENVRYLIGVYDRSIEDN